MGGHPARGHCYEMPRTGQDRGQRLLGAEGGEKAERLTETRPLWGDGDVPPRTAVVAHGPLKPPRKRTR